MFMSYTTNVSWAVNKAKLWDSEEAEKYILNEPHYKPGVNSGVPEE
jgi:hypothetical protein